MPNKPQIPIDYDTQWKLIITSLFPDFVKFFLPKAYKLIDFSQPIEFLEQELHKIIADKYKTGKVINDKLVKVKLKSGEEKWILIHIEVQSSYDSDFTERMFTYFYRIYDRYDQKITAIAIYTNESIPKNADTFKYAFLGTENTYKFNTYRVTSAKEKELLRSKNPFSLIVLASQYLLKSKSDSNKRYIFKRNLIKLAKERKYSDEQIVNLLRFIDLTLRLPKKLEEKFEKEIIETYIKPEGMITKKSDRFANQLYLALYGESMDERINKEKIMEKTLIVQKLLALDKISLEQIASVVNERVDFVQKIQEMLKEN